MKKRIISLLMALVMTLSLVPTAVWASDVDMGGGTAGSGADESAAGGVYQEETTGTGIGGGVYEAPAGSEAETAESPAAPAAQKTPAETPATSELVTVISSGGLASSYDSLAKAFAVANLSSGYTVRLNANVKIDTDDGGGINVSGDVTLDLNGKKVERGTGSVMGYGATPSLFDTNGTGKLTIQDSAGGGVIEQTQNYPAVTASKNGTVIIKGGTIRVLSEAKDENSRGGYLNAAVFVNAGTVEIKGGTIEGGQRGIYVTGSAGKLTVSGDAQISGTKSYALQVEEGAVQLQGGTYTTGRDDSQSIWNMSGSAESLLDSGYRYEDGTGNVSAYSEDGSAVLGTTVVEEIPLNEVQYIDAAGETQTRTDCRSLTAEGFTGLTANSNVWFVADTDITTGENYPVIGTVNLILRDGVTVKLNRGLSLQGLYTQPATLNIFAQKNGTGRLEVTADETARGYAGIRNGSSTDDTAVTLHIYGGNITATGGSFEAAGYDEPLGGAGIGTDAEYNYDSAMTVNIHGGTVTAKAGCAGAAAIGMGAKCSGGTVKVNIGAGLKRVKTGTENTACGYDNTDGTSVTITKCESHVWSYTDNGDGTHTKACSLCGMIESVGVHDYTTWTVDANDKTQHTGRCACGATQTGAHNIFAFVPNPDDLTHQRWCVSCHYVQPADMKLSHSYEKREKNGVQMWLCICGAQMAAEYNDTQYASIKTAVNAAKSSGGTVKVALNVAECVRVMDGTVIFDLDGNVWKASPNTFSDNQPLTVMGGNVTLKNGRLYQGRASSEAGEGLMIRGGSVTVEGDVSIQGGRRGPDQLHPSIDLQSGQLTLSEGVKLLTGMKVPEGQVLADYLPENTAFVMCSEDSSGEITVSDPQEFVPGVYTGNETTESMAVVAHTHTGSPCACGYVCRHESGWTADGKCIACGAAAAAQVNGTDYYGSLPAALKAAQDGDTVKLLADHVTDWQAAMDEENPDLSTLAAVTSVLTLDLNGKTVDYLMVGEPTYGEEDAESETIDVAITSGSLTVTDTGTDASGSVADIAFMSGELHVQGGLIGEYLDDGTRAGGIDCAERNGGENITSETTYGGKITIDGGTVFGLRVKEDVTVTVTGGTGHDGVWNCDYGELMIQQGAFDQVSFSNNGGTIAISGGTFRKIINQDASWKIPVRPLLAKNSAFYGKDADGQYSVLQACTDDVKQLTDVMVKEHSHVLDETGVCSCGLVAVAKDNEDNYYGSLQEALHAVVGNGTVTLVTNANENVTFAEDDKSVTLEMGGYTLTAQNIDSSALTVSGGTLTVAGDATIVNPETDVLSDRENLEPAITISGGKLVFTGDLTAQGGTFDDGANRPNQKPAVYATGGELDFQKGLDLKGGLLITGSAKLTNGLTQGTFYVVVGIDARRLSVEGSSNYKHVGALLADGYAFVDKEDRNTFRCANASYKFWTGDVTIVAHEHTWGPAGELYECTVCGKSCAHEGGYETGACPVCGKPCPHAIADQSPNDYNYYCNKCHQQMFARIQTDTYKWSHFTNLTDALTAAQNGQTVVLLGDVELTKDAYLYNESAATAADMVVTLNLNGHNVMEGRGAIILGVGESDWRNPLGQKKGPFKLIIRGSGNIESYMRVIARCALDLSDWTGSTINLLSLDDNSACTTADREPVLTVGANAGTFKQLQIGNWNLPDISKTKLSGGTYEKIWRVNGDSAITFGNVLADGYAFKKSDGTYVGYREKLEPQEEINNLSVVKCPHTGAPEAFTGSKCPYCDTALVAIVTKAAAGAEARTTGLTALNAETLASAENGTLKLLADAETLTVSETLTLDLNGHGVTTLTVEGDLTLADLLPEGYGFKSGGVWLTETELKNKTASDVTMAQAPIRSLTIAADQTTCYPGDTIVLTANAETIDGAAVSAYRWSRNGETLEDAAAGTPEGQYRLLFTSTGTYTISCTAHSGDYAVTSRSLTVTVKPIDLSDAEVTFDKAQYSYDGSAVEPKITVKVNGKTLQEDTDYIVSGTRSATDAGDYTVTITGKDNYTGTVADVVWKIDPMQLDRLTSVDPVSKTYDGTAAVTLPKSAVRFYSKASPAITLPEDAFDITNARFTMRQADGTYVDSPDAGDGKTVAFTVTLKSGNYVLLENKKPCTTAEYYYATDAAETFFITRAAAPAVTDGVLTITNDLKKTYETALSTFLPTQASPRRYGEIDYGIPRIVIDDGYYQMDGIKVENGRLILPIEANAVTAEGEVGRVDLTVSTTNYEDFALTIIINAKNKLIPTGAPTLSKSAITYGDKLSTITLRGAMEYESEEVPGSFVWLEPASVPHAGTYPAQWRFTPDDTDVYQIVTGSTDVTVGKAALTVTAEDKSVVFGNDAPAFTIRYTGFVNGDDAGKLSGTLDFTCAYAKGSGVREEGYAITPKGLESADYRITFTAGKLTVTKAEAVVTAPGGRALTYTGQKQELIEPGTTTGGTLWYRLDGTSLWGDTSPEATDAGTYTVWYRVSGGDNYEDVAAKSVEVTIQPAQLQEITVTQEGTLTYNGQQQTAGVAAGAVTVDNSPVRFTYSASENGSYTAAVPACLSAGTHTLYYKASAANHTEAAGSFTVEIGKKDITGAAIALENSLTYNGAEQTQGVASVSVDGMAVPAGTYTVTDNTGTDVKEYTLTVTVNSGNFTGTATKTWRIAPMDIARAVITLGDTPVYNGQEQTQGIASVKMGELDVTYDVSGNTGKDAKDYTLTITGKDNFTGTATKTWHIDRKSIAAAAVVLTEELVYTGKAQKPEIKTVTVDGLTLAEGTDYTAAFRSGESAGRYPMTLTGKGNYIGTAEREFTIGKAAALPVPEITVDVTNGYAGSYQVDLAAALQNALPAGCTLGAVEYGGVNFAGNEDYCQNPDISRKGVLTLKTKAVDSQTEGDVGTITVTADTGNYQETTLTVRLNARNKIIPTGAPVLSTSQITQGQKLGDICLSGAMRDGKTVVRGTFTWAEPYQCPTAGKYSAEWIFTPEDGSGYAVVSGTADITVKESSAPTYNVGGKVTEYNLTGSDRDEQPVEGAVVTIRKGLKILGGEKITGADGLFTLDGVTAGTYNVVVEYGGKIVTSKVVVTDHDEDLPVAIPRENVNSQLEIADAAGLTDSIVVGGLDKEAAAQMGSGGQTDGASVTVRMEIRESAADKDDEAQKAIREKASGKELDFMDIDLTLVKDGVEREHPQTAELLEIVVPYDTGRNGIAVLRYVNGEAQELEQRDPAGSGEGFWIDTESQSIHIFANSFDTYAIGYEKAPDNDHGRRYPAGSTAGGTEDGKTVKSVDTGDMGVAVYALTALLSIGGTALLKRRRED